MDIGYHLVVSLFLHTVNPQIVHHSSSSNSDTVGGTWKISEVAHDVIHTGRKEDGKRHNLYHWRLPGKLGLAASPQ